jgi:hypothetical protein
MILTYEETKGVEPCQNGKVGQCGHPHAKVANPADNFGPFQTLVFRAAPVRNGQVVHLRSVHLLLNITK